MNPRRLLIALLGVAVLVTTSGCGVTAPSRSEGYADFDAPHYRGMKRDTSISLGPRVLRFAANHVDDDPETEALLRAVDGVRVSVYQLSESLDRDALVGSLAQAASDLVADEWQPIVRVTEDEQTVFVLLKQNESSIIGVTVLTADHEEFVFVNVMGDLSPEVLAEVAGEVPVGNALALAAGGME